MRTFARAWATRATGYSEPNNNQRYTAALLIPEQGGFFKSAVKAIIAKKCAAFSLKNGILTYKKRLFFGRELCIIK